MRGATDGSSEGDQSSEYESERTARTFTNDLRMLSLLFHSLLLTCPLISTIKANRKSSIFEPTGKSALKAANKMNRPPLRVSFDDGTVPEHEPDVRPWHGGSAELMGYTHRKN